MANLSHREFSLGELFSNDSGKTSGTAFVGIIISLVGTFCFFLGCIDKMWISQTIDIITQSIVLVGIGATLLGVRKVVNSSSTPLVDPGTTDQPIQQINS